MATPSFGHEHPSSEAISLPDVAARTAGDSALFASAEARDPGLEARYGEEDSRDAGRQVHDHRAVGGASQAEVRCVTARLFRFVRRSIRHVAAASAANAFGAGAGTRCGSFCGP